MGVQGNLLLGIDPTTGATTVLSGRGLAGFENVRGLAFDPGTHTLYGAANESNELITIDTTTGTGAAVGALGFDDVRGLTFDPNTNTLYGADNDTNGLITIDTATGAGTAVGALGFATVIGLAFDPGTNTPSRITDSVTSAV